MQAERGGARAVGALADEPLAGAVRPPAKDAPKAKAAERKEALGKASQEEKKALLQQFKEEEKKKKQ